MESKVDNFGTEAWKLWRNPTGDSIILDSEGRYRRSSKRPRKPLEHAGYDHKELRVVTQAFVEIQSEGTREVNRATLKLESRPASSATQEVQCATSKDCNEALVHAYSR